MFRTYPSMGVQTPELFLPRPGVDLTRWATIACDQFTSQPDYWRQVEQLVGEAPSTYRLIFPEIFLGETMPDERIRGIQLYMREYLRDQTLVPRDGLLYVERTYGARTRRGLLLCVDLETYDYRPGSQSLIRPTEETILDRLPPRMRIRESALLELPHILLLIDDPADTVLGPIAAQKDQLGRLYDFDLMLDSGHLAGYGVDRPALEAEALRALEALAQPEAFRARYGIGADQAPLLFAVGDGNHSLATAKMVWEKIRSIMGLDHPARYALVEVENLHDPGLEFEPIHRVLFGLRQPILSAMQGYYGARFGYRQCQSLQEMVEAVDLEQPGKHLMGMVRRGEVGVIEIIAPDSHLGVDTLQRFLDDFMQSGGAQRIDYVHGAEVVCELGLEADNVGFYLPVMPKADLFKTVLLDGVLPRKAFSMGEAREKRFYMEARRIAW